MLASYATWLAGENALRPLLPLLDLASSLTEGPLGLAARAPVATWTAPPPAPDGGPSVDVLETETGLEIVCDMPGVRRDGVSVVMESGVLTIQARRTFDYTRASVRRAERYQGDIARSFRLGAGYDPDHVSATLDDGVLVVRIAKRPEATPKRIPVHFGAETAGSKQLGGGTGQG
jgi:HSP20 family protein